MQYAVFWKMRMIYLLCTYTIHEAKTVISIYRRHKETSNDTLPLIKAPQYHLLEIIEQF